MSSNTAAWQKNRDPLCLVMVHPRRVQNTWASSGTPHWDPQPWGICHPSSRPFRGATGLRGLPDPNPVVESRASLQTRRPDRGRGRGGGRRLVYVLGPSPQHCQQTHSLGRWLSIWQPQEFPTLLLPPALLLTVFAVKDKALQIISVSKQKYLS